MAVIKVVNSKASIGKAINYITKEEKTEERLISGKDCNPFTTIDEMKATKEQWGKTEGRQYKHYIQSFDPKDKMSHAKAHQIGVEWAEKNFKGHSGCGHEIMIDDDGETVEEIEDMLIEASAHPRKCVLAIRKDK